MRLYLSCALLLVASLASAAHYDPDTEIARRHFAAASKLYDAEQYQAALKEFTLAKRVKPLPAFDFNIGRCHDRLEEFQEAIKFYEMYVSANPPPSDAPQVRDRIVVLKKRLTDEAAAAEAAKRAAAEDEKKKEEKGAEGMEFALAPDDKVIVPAGASAKPSAGAQPAASKTKLVAGVALLGGGVVLAAAGGTGFGLAGVGVAQSIIANAKSQMPKPYDQSANSLGNTFQGLEVASIVVGAAAAVVGGALVGMALKESKPESPSVSAAPWLQPGLAGLACSGKF